MANKELILNTVSDLVGSFLYYDRKEDEDLPQGAIESAVLKRELYIEDIVERFRNGLINSIHLNG